MKKISFLLLSVILSMVSIQAFAYDVAVENGNGKTIYYNYVNGTELQVISGYNKYSGDINIPANVTIGNNVYSVTSIGMEAFSYCSGLTSISIPNSVTSIGSFAFEGCSALTSITIPNSVTSIRDAVFLKCSGLISIIVEEGNTVYDSRGSCNGIIQTLSNTLVSGCKNTIIPNSVTSIGYAAFYGCSGLTSITLPDGVTSIGTYAFSECSSLTSINIPDGVTSIGRSAFRECASLTSITIPNSVTSIGDWAFYECSGLTSITIPNGVTSIGEYAFYNCLGLTSVISLIESPYSYGSSAFSGISSVCVLTVPRGTRDAYIAAGWTEDVFKGGVVEAPYEKLIVNDTEISLGKRRNLSIELQNEANVTALQFDIVLPDGFSIAENQNGKLIVSKTSRCPDHTLSTAKQNENTYRVLLYSVDVDEITGNSGTVINVTLETADNIAEGPYEVRLSNINLTMPDETKILPADATCTFTVRDVISGDSNGDGVVDVTDIVGIANAILGRAGNTFDPLAADLNGDGVFDVTDIVVLANLILHGNSQPGVKAFNISDLLDPQ